MARRVETFTVTRYMARDAAKSDFYPTPGLVLTREEVRACVVDAVEFGGYTSNVLCDDCGNSVADCPKLGASLGCPVAWSLRTA